MHTYIHTYTVTTGDVHLSGAAGLAVRHPVLLDAGRRQESRSPHGKSFILAPNESFLSPHP